MDNRSDAEAIFKKCLEACPSKFPALEEYCEVVQSKDVLGDNIVGKLNF